MDDELVVLRTLAKEFANADAAIAEIARLSAILTLPKGPVHVISDVHGEDKKLRHVINNASGALRPLVERVVGPSLAPSELQSFLTLCFYPAEVVAEIERSMPDPVAQRAFAIGTLRRQFLLVRTLVSQYSLRRATRLFPAEYRELITEMLHEPTVDRGSAFVEAIVDQLLARGRALHLVHLVGRLIRNLAVHELVIGGDCWDRGPRGDRVVDYLLQQPNVSFVWGNHDAAWIGATLGQEALICNVLRVSLRYRRLSQLDDGYGIPLTPLEHLARTVYADDPAAHFMPKAEGLRPSDIVARMQKAAAIVQFKLEGQAIARNPQWGLDHRRLLHRIDHAKGTITIDGVEYALRDRLFPTIDPADPYKLTPEEASFLRMTRESFINSQKLQDHIRFIIANGAMSLVRDGHLIFHGCVPCDAAGDFLPMTIDGNDVAGSAMFNAIEATVLRAFETRDQRDVDLFWYLWSGPRSPLFGKDKIATFERDFVTDPHSHHETKDPYFALIHEKDFCEKVLHEFGVCTERGLIVNGHVPVKVEKGEDPMKRSGKAITIDGAFSEAYGDHGYTLVIDCDRTLLALHHHFDSVEAAIQDGVDIVPEISVVRRWCEPRKIADTEQGADLRCQIRLLEQLIATYKRNVVKPSASQ